MKSIKVKAYNKLVENIIKEDSIKLDGDTGDFKGKLKKRIIDAVRLAKECRAAAKIARENGDEESAAWLEQRAEDYEIVAKTWNQDTIDDDEDEIESPSDTDDSKETEKSGSDRAKDAANRAKRAAQDAQDSADEAQRLADELKDKGEDNSAAQAAADKAKAKAAEAKQAAEEAQEHADAAEQAEKAGDKDKANSEADQAEDAADKAEEAADEASEAANSSGGEDKDSDSSDSDDRDTDSAGTKNNSNKSSGKNSDNSDSEDDTDSDDSEDSDDTDSDDDSDDDSDSNSSSKSKGSKSGQSSDSSEDEGENDSEDEDSDDESDSDDAPIKDPFADDEDIPQMPSPGQMGQEPRDPTVDEIIKQLSKLDGEAKRGAIDGLTDLLKNKKESLSEAFKKGIREFSDDEWDDLNDETIDKIEKVKHIDTIDNVDDIKATFKGWSENEVSRQELQDEENQNIQRDVLAKRAKEKEIEKYSNLESLHDFEIDFENCIRDQVELVMQEYQTYDEINPEYELEDTIMKADVQRMIPDEAIPTVAIFFDQSSSWSAADVDKGKKAIATVKQKYVDTGLCKLDIWYFADRVGPTPYGIGGSTTAWPYIVKTIADNDYKNVIIMTDSDMNDWNNHGESYTVEGCVWWIWRYGLRAENLPKQVKGMQHNFECSFS